MANLKRWNFVACGIQAGLFFLCLSWAIAQWDSLSKTGVFPLEIGRYRGDKITDVPTIVPVFLLAVFTAVTAAFHFRAARQAKPTLPNTGRWVEYSITATIMAIVLALSSAVFALDALLLILFATACCMLCGLATDWMGRAAEQKRARYLVTGVGWLLIAGVFAAIIFNYASVATQAPWFVHAIFATMLVLYISFGVVHLWDVRRESPDESYLVKVEKRYIALSMLAKSALVLLLFSGLVVRSSQEEGEEPSGENTEK